MGETTDLLGPVGGKDKGSFGGSGQTKGRKTGEGVLGSSEPMEFSVSHWQGLYFCFSSDFPDWRYDSGIKNCLLIDCVIL